MTNKARLNAMKIYQVRKDQTCAYMKDATIDHLINNMGYDISDHEIEQIETSLENNEPYLLIINIFKGEDRFFITN